MVKCKAIHLIKNFLQTAGKVLKLILSSENDGEGE